MASPEEPKGHQPEAETGKLLSDFRKSLNADEMAFVSAWEESHGREMTDQEIRLGLEQLRIIRELE